MQSHQLNNSEARFLRLANRRQANRASIQFRNDCDRLAFQIGQLEADLRATLSALAEAEKPVPMADGARFSALVEHEGVHVRADYDFDAEGDIELCGVIVCEADVMPLLPEVAINAIEHAAMTAHTDDDGMGL